jgi:hypothetical protein
VIYRGEISKSSALNAYDAVRLLRPAFLAGRGPTSLLRVRESSHSPVVYLDNQRSAIRQRCATSRSRDRRDSLRRRHTGTNALGMDHPAGAILVLTGAARRVP